jgi:YidC/Oxa1 family membrane protein insertase
MDKKTLFAFVLIMGIWMVWMEQYAPKPPAQNQQSEGSKKSQLAESGEGEQGQGAQQKIQGGAADSQSLSSDSTISNASNNRQGGSNKGGVSTPEVPLEIVTLENNTLRIELANQEPFLRAWDLKNYQRKIRSSEVTNEQSADISLKNLMGSSAKLAFQAPENFSNTGSYRWVEKSSEQAVMRMETESGWVEHRFELRTDFSPYVVDLQTTYEFNNPQAQASLVGWSFEIDKMPASATSFFSGPSFSHRDLGYYNNHEYSSASVGQGGVFSGQGMAEGLRAFNTRWAGINMQYFFYGLVFDHRMSDAPVAERNYPLVQTRADTENRSRADVLFSTDKKPNGFQTALFFGPKSLDKLQAVSPTLDMALDLGWLSSVSIYMLKLLKWFYSFVGNYGVAIVLLTLVVRGITFPLQYKSTKSMKAMAQLQPEMARIKEKYKDDREKLNKEMMSILKQNKVNPMGGCLPMLIQLPIFIALYRVLYSAIELYQAPFFGWIQDLSEKDPYYILPIAMGISMFFQMKLSPQTNMDPNQRKIMMAMPIFFSVIMFNLPAGLNLYIFVSTLFGILQQLWMNRKFDIQASVSNPKEAKA